ncbi:Metallo-hydrolase/oxidoreductase [Violaceomyces palustris]|uniref:Metallo-hydrolase/oxidoreductase n=1 Tax=Violaceomyces palustris TaxID=1673888 RepID=A0ACD0P7C6_9BASI|nr:Metallo-hydrolase/oxidoreductase [Violaceomyces palustris]
MTTKVAIQDISRLSRRVIRILGQNPGPYTLAGTNTYIITPHLPSTPTPSRSTRTPSILVDTGEGAESYVPLLERVLQGETLTEASDSPNLKDGEDGDLTKIWISDIILTHRHNDHVGGLPSVLNLLNRLKGQNTSPSTSSLSGLPAPRIHKFPDPGSDPALIAKLKALPEGSFTYFTDPNGSSPLWPLKDGDVVSVTGEVEGEGGDLKGGPGQSTSRSSVRVLHTPGHTSDHICLMLVEDKVLLTGDHVLGQGTSVFEDLGSYLSSLRKCSRELQVSGPSPIRLAREALLFGENQLYPAHGPVVEEGRKALQTYLEHRLNRERQLIELLSTSPPDDPNPNQGRDKMVRRSSQVGERKPWKIREIVLKLYSNYPENLFPAAARGIFLHLHSLSRPEEAMVKCLQEPKFLKGRSPEEGPVPLPRLDSEWFEVMELDWCLIDRQGDDRNYEDYLQQQQQAVTNLKVSSL